MWSKILEIGQTIALWLSSRPNRLRLRGARIEVIASIFALEPEPSILLGQSYYHKLWTIPQEGVRLKESFEDALFRCLEIEYGLDLPKSANARARAIHLRSIRYMGTLALPKNRHGERPVVPDAIGTPLEFVALRAKAYWMATMLVRTQNDIMPKPDGRELVDLRWFTLRDARHAILRTNRSEKAALLTKCLNTCKQDLRGAPRW